MRYAPTRAGLADSRWLPSVGANGEMQSRERLSFQGAGDLDKQGGVYPRRYEESAETNMAMMSGGCLGGFAVHSTHAAGPWGCWPRKTRHLHWPQTSAAQRAEIHRRDPISETGKTRMI